MKTNRFFESGLPEVLWLLPLETSGPSFDVRSEYVETLWLPVLGPSATWLVRRLGTLAAAFPQGTWIDTAELSVSIGLGAGYGLLTRSLRRLLMFSVADVEPGDVLRVRTCLGPVSDRSLERLPPVLVAEHNRMCALLRSCAAA
jgi:hypothetical protein